MKKVLDFPLFLWDNIGMMKTGDIPMSMDEQLERLAKAHKRYLETRQLSKGNSMSKTTKTATKGRVLPDLKTIKAMEARIAELEAREAALEAKANRGLTLKISEKGGVQLNGLRRFPVTFYKNEWLKILDKAPELLQFIKENESRLAVKR